MRRVLVLLLVAAAFAAPALAAGDRIAPGRSIGPVAVGDERATLAARLGGDGVVIRRTPNPEAPGNRNLDRWRWPTPPWGSPPASPPTRRAPRRRRWRPGRRGTGRAPGSASARRGRPCCAPTRARRARRGVPPAPARRAHPLPPRRRACGAGGRLRRGWTSPAAGRPGLRRGRAPVGGVVVVGRNRLPHRVVRRDGRACPVDDADALIDGDGVRNGGGRLRAGRERAARLGDPGVDAAVGVAGGRCECGGPGRWPAPPASRRRWCPWSAPLRPPPARWTTCRPGRRRRRIRRPRAPGRSPRWRACDRAGLEACRALVVLMNCIGAQRTPEPSGGGRITSRVIAAARGRVEHPAHVHLAHHLRAATPVGRPPGRAGRDRHGRPRLLHRERRDARPAVGPRRRPRRARVDRGGLQPDRGRVARVRPAASATATAAGGCTCWAWRSSR